MRSRSSHARSFVSISRFAIKRDRTYRSLCLRDVAENILVPERKQLGFHLGFDIKMMRKEGHKEPHQIEDGILNAHLLNENELSFKMEYLAGKYIDPSYAVAEEALTDKIIERFGGSRKTAKKHLHELPASEVAAYACQDVETNEVSARFSASSPGGMEARRNRRPDG